MHGVAPKHDEKIVYNFIFYKTNCRKSDFEIWARLLPGLGPDVDQISGQILTDFPNSTPYSANSLAFS